MQKAPTQLLVLRSAWWSAVVLLVMHVVIWSGMLDWPSTFVGSDEGSSARLHWIPIVLLVWVFVGQRMIATKRSTEAPTNRAIEAVRGFVSGSAVIFLMILLLGVVVVAISVMARAAGALLT